MTAFCSLLLAITIIMVLWCVQTTRDVKGTRGKRPETAADAGRTGEKNYSNKCIVYASPSVVDATSMGFLILADQRRRSTMRIDLLLAGE